MNVTPAMSALETYIDQHLLPICTTAQEVKRSLSIENFDQILQIALRGFTQELRIPSDYVLKFLKEHYLAPKDFMR